MSSRWADTAEDREHAQRLKAEKAARKAAKEEARRRREAAAAPPPTPPTKKRRTNPSSPSASSNSATTTSTTATSKPLRFPAPEIAACRHVDTYEPLNRIEEGSYGIVSRARDTETGEIVALKRLKLERETDGFPITSLREIRTLMAARRCEGVVGLREVVMGDSLKDVYIVMDFIPHDLKTLFDDMPEPFLLSETKTLLHQLLTAVSFLHSHWILHRDLKTSNLLLSHTGQLKIADFGLARFYGDPRPPLTQLVVTLWYRAPELLLGGTTYGPEIDLWSCGCIFAELMTREPLLQGKNEIDQVAQIFQLLGVPTEESWPGWRAMPNSKGLTYPKTQATVKNHLRTRFPLLTAKGVELLDGLLKMDPKQRWSAEEALSGRGKTFWMEEPRMKRREMLPTWPSKASGEKRRKRGSPGAPVRGDAPVLEGNLEVKGLFDGEEEEVAGAGFALRMGR
ncbi:Pkinase-domain-containing protein [Ascodesmis nigricans]|uniref:cyclin-dependent kinase n=1 Tax=Ascodesmis nigricans TaxID=341454 RepID=A0A4S2N4K4_9PEZI|nr:Pkinase-domain-containing protein [Ascodesmis nigricans]